MENQEDRYSKASKYYASQYYEVAVGGSRLVAISKLCILAEKVQCKQMPTGRCSNDRQCYF